MSFWVEHGLHLALVAIPSSAMGTGLLVERRKGVRQRDVTIGPAGPPSTSGEPPVFAPKDWLASPKTASDGKAKPPVVGPREAVRHPLALPAVAISAAGAALTHLVVMPEHFAVSFLYGIFFLGAAILQMSWAVTVVYRPTRAVLLAGALGCAATIVLWAVSRTTGIPAALGGVDGGAPETVGALDLLATGFESVAVIGVIIALRGLRFGAGSPARWPTAAKTMAVTALCGTAALAFWAPVN